MAKNKELSIIRKGEISLHVISFNDFTRRDWTAFFKSPQEAQFALDDEQGVITRGQANPNDVRTTLSELIISMTGGEPQQDTYAGEYIMKDPQQMSQQLTVQGSPYVSVPSSVAPSEPETIITDKGTFFHIGGLKMRLGQFTEDDSLFTKACAQAGVDIFCTYLSEGAKKKVAKAYREIVLETEV